MVYKNLSNSLKKVYFLKTKNSVILPVFIGKIVKIYNGRFFFNLRITTAMVGYKFGIFVFTRKLHVFKVK